MVQSHRLWNDPREALTLLCLAVQGCSAAFTSIMGYVYHMKKCGKEEAELEKMLLSCSHCGKTYRSKAGLEYHLKSEHAPVSLQGPRLLSLRIKLIKHEYCHYY